MSKEDKWLLPEGVEEVLPGRASRIELVRRRLLDLYQQWGYQLVFPPLIEYLDSLLTGAGSDLDLQTFKITDQLSGRLMGIRADITPQVARIDAHSIKANGPLRLCYTSTVLHNKPAGHSASRIPYQTGVELFGHAGPESDIEVLGLMLEVLSLLEISDVTLDLGHVGIFRGLVEAAGLSGEQEAELSNIYQRKALPELGEFLEHAGLDENLAEMIRQLPGLAGDETVLEKAASLLSGAPKPVLDALENLGIIAKGIKQSGTSTRLYFDLSELRGYRYHTGCVFAAYIHGQSAALVKGGRYDEIGQVYGRARPATGFSADLKLLVDASPVSAENSLDGILAPANNDASLQEKIRELREAGETVISLLSNDSQESKVEINELKQRCNRVLEKNGSSWEVKDLN